MSGVRPNTNGFAVVLSGEAERVALSVITFYEIGQKVRLGQWTAMAPQPPRLVEQALDRSRLWD